MIFLVVYSRGAADYIQSFTKPLIKDIQVPEILDAIEAWQGTVTESMRKSHVENLARRRKILPKVDTSEPVCPRCSAHMVLRHRKSDGGAFYGCSNFPRCYGIVNIDGRCA